MTDEQVDRIVQALQGGDPWWAPWLLTLIGALIGFGLSQLQLWITRRSDRREQASAVKSTVVRDATVHILYLISLTKKDRGLQRDQLNREHARIAAILGDIDGLVAYWWLRQVKRILDGAPGADAGSTAERLYLIREGAKTAESLKKWAAGELPSSELSAADDDEDGESSGS